MTVPTRGILIRKAKRFFYATANAALDKAWFALEKLHSTIPEVQTKIEDLADITADRADRNDDFDYPEEQMPWTNVGAIDPQDAISFGPPTAAYHDRVRAVTDEQIMGLVERARRNAEEWNKQWAKPNTFSTGKIEEGAIDTVDILAARRSQPKHAKGVE